MNDLPLLTTLEKQIILVLGEGLNEFLEVSRFTGQDIKYNLNRLNEQYSKPYRSSVPYSTLKQLLGKDLVDTILDERKTYYMLNEKGIRWYRKAKKIEHHIFQT